MSFKKSHVCYLRYACSNSVTPFTVKMPRILAMPEKHLDDLELGRNRRLREWIWMLAQGWIQFTCISTAPQIDRYNLSIRHIIKSYFVVITHICGTYHNQSRRFFDKRIYISWLVRSMLITNHHYQIISSSQPDLTFAFQQVNLISVLNCAWKHK